MLRTTRRVAVAVALASAVALAGAASASAASIGGLPSSAPIISKLYVPVSVTVSCEPFDPFFMFGSASVTIRQLVSGKNIAHGTGSANELTCDGTPHPQTVNVFPDSGIAFPGLGGDSPPFAKGDAVVSATLSTMMGTSYAGPQSIKLTK
ncbi:MAG: hypothetical protein QOJ89_2366 [bacterium]|jgi:hypothetical protein